MNTKKKGYWRIQKYLEFFILMQHPWPNRERKSFEATNQINVLHGENMDYWDGILDHIWNTIFVTKYL